MTNKHIANGSIIVSQEKISFLDALTNFKNIKIWLSSKIIEDQGKTSFKTGEIFQWGRMDVTIYKKKEKIEWICTSELVDFVIEFKMNSKRLITSLKSSRYNICTFLQDWIIIFYRLQEYVETGNIIIPEFQESDVIEKGFTLSIPINTENSKIYSVLTNSYYLSQIFSKYPECDLENFKYTWGWLEEGPSNLISWKNNSILIHDFISDFNPIGYIKWELENIKGEMPKLKLSHMDINLNGEFDQLKAFNSYKRGWMYFLIKIKDLVENDSFKVHFIDEILD